jgi:hypothetical protein
MCTLARSRTRPLDVHDVANAPPGELTAEDLRLPVAPLFAAARAGEIDQELVE